MLPSNIKPATAALLAAGLLCILFHRDARRSLWGQQPTEKSNQPAKLDGADKKPEAKLPVADIGPPGFPHSGLAACPVEPIPPFADRNFKVGVLARVKNVDLAKECVTVFMGKDERTFALDRAFRLFRVASSQASELARTELTNCKASDCCQVTLEAGKDGEKVTHIHLMSCFDAKKITHQEVRTKEEELRRYIVEWKNAIRSNNDERRGRKLLTAEQVLKGREVIAECERQLVFCGIDCEGDGLRFHTRGGVKNVDLDRKHLTLFQGPNERLWKIGKTNRVFVVTVFQFSEYVEPQTATNWDCIRWQPVRKSFTITKAKDGLTRLRNNSQVYVTFDNDDTVTRIDILEQERLPPLVLPELPWLPFHMTDEKETK